jgi:hypothetical protein
MIVLIKNSVYVRINKYNSVVYSYGIKFKDFSNGLGIVKCYLILAGSPNECHFNYKLNLEYVTKEQSHSLVSQDVNAFGDFCWVDFDNEAQLDLVTSEELAKLLFMSHTKKPLDTFKFESLMNEYAYLSHDDGTWNNTYMRNIFQYKNILKYKVTKELKELGKENNIDNTLFDKLYEMCFDGLLIDFDDIKSNEINLYVLNNINTVDDLENGLIASRRNDCNKKLKYFTKEKIWRISDS